MGYTVRMSGAPAEPRPEVVDPAAFPPYAVGQLLRRAHAQAARAFSAALAPTGIEGRHFGVLAALAAGGPQTQRDLVERVGSDRVSMMRIVDDLEARDLAVRRPVPGDRRLRAVELTDLGREVFHTAEQIAHSTADALLTHLEPDERAQLTRLLWRLIQTPTPDPA